MLKLCEKCNIEISAKDFPIHEQGKKHLRNVAFQNRKEASIFVSRLPPNATNEKIATYFGQYGDVEKCNRLSHYALLEFKKKETVNDLLTKNFFMDGYKLDVRRQRWNNTAHQNTRADQYKIEKLTRETSFVDLKLKLMEQNTFESELVAFLKFIQPNDEENEQDYSSIRSSLLATLRPSFPCCDIIRFGSSTTGLSFKGSDIDIYLKIGERIHEEEEAKFGWTMGTIFKEVKLSLYRRRSVFDKIVPIPGANVPIIKFCHIPTRRNCDIAFKTGLGVINSELIKQLLDADPRLKPFVIIMKYWARNFELSEGGKFTNYAIVMIAIFYFQQPEVKLLPPLLELMKNCEPIYEWNWQVNFNRNAIFPPSPNESGMIELLRGFFEFYAVFPFADMVISPLDGSARPRADFGKWCTTTGCDPDGYGVDRAVCVQDPIELDRNITYGVTIKLRKSFQSFCAVGAEVCNTALENKDKPFLLNLFTTVPSSVKEQGDINFVISARKEHWDILMGSLPEKTHVKDKEKFTENKWYSLVQDFIEDALKSVFKLDIQRLRDDYEAKHQKVTEMSNVHSQDNTKTVLECTSTYCVIDGRKSKGFAIDPSLSPIEKEAFISEEIVNRQTKENVKLPKIDFTCTILKKKRPLRFLLRLSNRHGAKEHYRKLAHFLRMQLPNIVYKEFMHFVQYGGLVPAVTTEHKPN